MISGLSSTSNSDRLAELGIDSLEDRRRKFDMIETYKLIYGFNKVPHNTGFTLVDDTNLPKKVERVYKNLKKI